jgi:hypothetical protein
MDPFLPIFVHVSLHTIVPDLNATQNSVDDLTVPGKSPDNAHPS